MGDPAGTRGAFLYYWPRYKRDTAAGPVLRLNQNSSTMGTVVPGDLLWVFAPAGEGQYAIVARMAAARTGENQPGSAAIMNDGRWFVEADPEGVKYFDPTTQPDASALIRSLDLRAGAAVLGQAFQGPAAVRLLSPEAARTLADAAESFVPDPKLSIRTSSLPRVNIRDLRNRQAVLDAMAEHDELPPGEFLRRYSYGEPDRYWIRHDGKTYPSKALLGVAWHYEAPSRPALQPSQFSGGEATVQRTAEALGFEVVVLPLRSVSDAASIAATPGARYFGDGPRYWWVNHKQTFRQEIGGGYVWSPKRNTNGGKNHFYDNMHRVMPGDVVFSYADGMIRFVGAATRTAASCSKPREFGEAGENWMLDGWMVPITWREVPKPLRPKAFIGELRPHLPAKYSPLQPDTGNGRQNVYLAAVPEAMATVLLDKLGSWAAAAADVLAGGIGEDDGALRTADDAVEAEVRSDLGLDETTRRAVVEARRGQGRFRLNVEAVERGCRVTGVADRRLLRASHIKPWRSCTTAGERLDGDNGLLLTPTADHLFDRGYISFADDGEVLFSPVLDPANFERLSLHCDPSPNVGSFSAGQRAYLAFHRSNVFLRGG